MLENEDCKSEQKYEANIQKVGQNGTSCERCRSKSFNGNFTTIEEDMLLIM